MVCCVAILLRSFEGGGMQRNLVNLAHGFLRRGIACEVLVTDDRGPARASLPAGVAVHRLAPGAGRAGVRALLDAVPGLAACDRLVLRFGPAPALVRALPDLAARLDGIRPDALLAIGTQANLAALLARPRLACAPRIVLSEHNVMSRVATLSRRRFRRLYPHFARALYPRADAIVAVSPAVAEDLAAITGLPPGRIRVVPNPVDADAIGALAAAPLPSDWSRNRRFLLAVGRLHWQKDFAAAIAAFARLAGDLPDLDLVILGEGPERRGLERRARTAGVAGRVHFRGHDPNPFRWMARASALLCTSRSEGFGHVLVEALACGCPVVAFDCPGAVSWVLGNGRYGTLVPMGEIGALAEAVRATLTAPPDREGLRARAGCFSPEAAIDAFAALLTGAVARDAA